MNKPFLTVFTPAYNRAYTLPRTYESMKQQKNTDFIWLIVDDGSSDNTAELVKQWQQEENDFEIQYVYKENGGMHTAHNTAYALIDTIACNVEYQHSNICCEEITDHIFHSLQSCGDHGRMILITPDSDSFITLEG